MTTSLFFERENSEPNVVLEPLYQRGCKITLGAKSGLRPPTFHEARTLVNAKRASQRIIAPAAALEIQLAWRQFKVRSTAKRAAAATAVQGAFSRHMAKLARRQLESERQAATTLQGTWRRHTAQQQLKTSQHAASTISSAFRCLVSRRRAASTILAVWRGFVQRRLFAKLLHSVLPALTLLQAAARGLIARRRLCAARMAIQLIQTTWRRVSDMVLRRRLARAADALRNGGNLGKYRKHGAITAARERHAKFVWVSDDLQRLHWAPSAEQRDDPSVVRTVPMAGVTAVVDGVKTRLMKKMEKRAAAAHDPLRTVSFGKRAISFGGAKQSAAAPAVGPLGGASFGRTLSVLKKPLSLDESCAFSVFCGQRVLDFVAEDKATRDRWLRDLTCVLRYAHHFDLTAAKLSVQKLAAAPAEGSSESDEEHA